MFNGRAATVREIARHAESIYRADPQLPIILAADGQVLDGMHRVARALLLGGSAIPARRLTTDPEPDWLLPE